MNIKEIEDNLAAVAGSLTQAGNVDTNSIMLLSMAQSLVVIIKLLQNEKDGTDDARNKLKI
mgnify:CR=1 FL=1|jgi:hypothetical protein